MYKLFGLIFSLVVTLPLTAHAVNIVDTNSYDIYYIYNDHYLIALDVGDEIIQGRAWTGKDWTETVDIFTNSNDEFNFDVTNDYLVRELNDGTILIVQNGHIVSYSSTNGFQYQSYEGSINKIIATKEQTTVIDCSNKKYTGYAKSWDKNGFGTSTILDGSVCTSDFNYLVGSGNVVIDYYTGRAYDSDNNFEIIASTDLSGLEYAAEYDDYDAQGDNPGVGSKKNGDVVFAYEQYLYGYAYHQQTWQPTIKLDDGFSVIQSSHESPFTLVETGNYGQIFAFAANDNNTEYQIYRWTSANGWQLEKTYSFTQPTGLILSNIDKSVATLDWAFWINDIDELQLYSWTKKTGYIKRAVRSLTSAGVGKLGISKKGKVFVTSSTMLSAWKPASDTWEDTELPSNAGSYRNTHITDKGHWVVTYYQKKNNLFSAKRWTPDGGWGEVAELNALNDVYYNDDKVYFITLDAKDTLTINRYKWNSRTIDILTEITNVDQFDDDTFIYNDYMFVLYDDTVKAVEL